MTQALVPDGRRSASGELPCGLLLCFHKMLYISDTRTARGEGGGTAVGGGEDVDGGSRVVGNGAGGNGEGAGGGGIGHDGGGACSGEGGGHPRRIAALAVVSWKQRHRLCYRPQAHPARRPPAEPSTLTRRRCRMCA